MPIIVFFFFILLVCKGCKALFRRHDHVENEQPETETENKVINNLAALDALQQQREQIQNTISYLKDAITTSETPEKTVQYMDRLSSLYGKLANVENKINKLMN